MPPEDFKVITDTIWTKVHFNAVVAILHVLQTVILAQIFCERVIAEKERNPTSVQSVLPQLFVAAEKQLVLIPFEDTNTVFYDMLDVSNLK